jgi:hypothetical protein
MCWRKGASNALRTWYESLGKTLWAVSPPSSLNVTAAERDREDEKVLAFLDRVYKSHGGKSVIYVRDFNIFRTLLTPSLDILRNSLLAGRVVPSLGCR